MSDQQYRLKSNGEQTGSAREFVFAEEIHYQDGHGSQSQSDLRPDGRPIDEEL